MPRARLTGLLIACMLGPGIARGEQHSGLLGSGASATDYYQVTCSDDGAGPPVSLVARVTDPAPVVEPSLSVQLRKGSAAINATDEVDADAASSPAVSINGGAGLYHVLVDKTGPGAEAYSVSLTCMTGSNGGGGPTGTTVVGFSTPPSGIDCSLPGGCSVTKYGLHAADSRRRGVDPLDPRQWSHADFTGSYAYEKASPDPAEPGCGGERDFAPIFGQFLLREQVGCVPGAASGCPVEFATDLANPALSPDPNRSFFGGARTLHSSVARAGSPSWLSLGIAADAVLEGSGMRYAIPGTQQTRIEWGEVRLIADEGTLCCNDGSAGSLCGTLGAGAWERYPLLNDLSDASGILMALPDWVFAGGAGSAFSADLTPVVSGQLHGVCAQNRAWGCTASGSGCAGSEPCDCNRDRCDPETQRCSVNASVVCSSHADCRGFAASDVCDLRESGWRLDLQTLLPTGEPDPAQCGGGLYVFRGYPGQGCSLVRRYAIDGDPGPDCAIQGFGSSIRPDENCDGVDDQVPDLCPYYSELDPFADANSNGRGDECECGDTAPLSRRRDGSLVGRGDGRLDVADLVATNQLIFAGSAGMGWDLVNPRCDSDAPEPLPAGYRETCNVSDLVATSSEIFSTGSTAHCPRASAPAVP
jgi:hypothetical protein